jgi:hypothetical protein
MRLVLVPRGGTVAWSADLDGDGAPEWVLESHRVRAVFRGQSGRWTEFTWKDSGVNVLPEIGAWTSGGKAAARESGGALEFSGVGWKRTVRLEDNRLTVEFEGPAAAGSPRPGKFGAVALAVTRDANRTVYTLN